MGKETVSTPAGSIETVAINTIRTLAMDAVEQAKSGHPGTPMALAPVAYTLWNEVLRYDPDQPLWPNRDRFMLSCGHASMLLYSVLHLAGVKQLSGRQTDRRTGRDAGPDQALPPVAQPLPGTSRALRNHRRRDHHRTAGPGCGQQRGHVRLPSVGWPRISTSPASRSCSTTTCLPCAATAT